MTDTDTRPRTRRARLAAIAAEYTEEIHDGRSARQIAGADPVSRFAAVTSEGSIESSCASNGNLLVADSTAALAELLRQEAGEGWLAHGRVWDLDAPWHLWGNLEVAYPVEVGEESGRHVHLVVVAGREDGIHLFEDLLDAETFAGAVRRHGGEARLTEEPLHGNRAADRLIEAEEGR
ncbi:MAG TPA: hypothetical protein VMH33_02775 [Solirubrobacterales bacterium]|nr:hypothetical protein [Solirubrobacterales bacterium]